jgi:hypothetical protein
MDFSPSFNLSEFESRAWSLRAIAGTGSAVASTAIPPMSTLRRLTSTVIKFPFLIIAYSTTNGPAPSEAAGPAPMAPNRWARKKVDQFRFTYRRSLGSLTSVFRIQVETL